MLTGWWREPALPKSTSRAGPILDEGDQLIVPSGRGFQSIVRTYIARPQGHVLMGVLVTVGARIPEQRVVDAGKTGRLRFLYAHLEPNDFATKLVTSKQIVERELDSMRRVVIEVDE